MLNKFLVVFLLLFLVSACTNKVPELKSPCVSGNGKQDPCGPRIKINQEWMQQYYSGVNV
jgi:hypothetical protein